MTIEKRINQNVYTDLHKIMASQTGDISPLTATDYMQKLQILGNTYHMDIDRYKFLSSGNNANEIATELKKFLRPKETDIPHEKACIIASILISSLKKCLPVNDNSFTGLPNHTSVTRDEIYHSVKQQFLNIFKDFQIIELHGLFAEIYNHGMTDIFTEYLKEESLLSRDFKSKFNKWGNLAKTKKWMLENPPKYSNTYSISNQSLPNDNSQKPVEEIKEQTPISPIKVVMVPDLLSEGEGAESVPDLVEVFNEKSGEKHSREIITEPRDEWILEALTDDPNVNHHACIQFENPLKTMDHTGRYYSVFHVVLINGNTTQIAVSTCKGQITYLMKEEHGLMVDPTSERCLKEISDLRHEPMVQTKRCHTKEGFQRDIMEIVFRAAGDLKPQTKSTTRWQGVMSRASQIEDSFIAFYVTNDRSPNRNDGLIIHGEYGKNGMGINKSLVELDTRWDLVDNALKQKSILGLEQYNSLHDYACSMINETQPQKDKKYAPAPL